MNVKNAIERSAMSVRQRLWIALISIFTSLILMAFPSALRADDTVCASVKIEIRQELTLERQAFDAQMKINNTTDTGVIENVAVEVKVTDESGVPISVTTDPNDLSAKFFLRVYQKQNISNVDGTGAVSPRTTAIIDWLIIPAPGSAGTSPTGKKYRVGATLRYRFDGEDTVLGVTPDVITVKPLPLLTLDYFLPRDVWADDPLTAEIEPIEPFTLGVRVRNSGLATARSVKIDSAQPRIVDNSQGLLINFQLRDSYVDDRPVQNTLLVDFGDIAAASRRMGRWNMETTLAGRFTDFTARFTHSDELGGLLTSLLQSVNAHFLIRNVLVDLPGRDLVRDFLANDGDVVRVYESDSADTEVADRSAVSSLTAAASGSSSARYQVAFPITTGFAYIRLPDPFHGQKSLGQVVRSDAKVIPPENVWLSKTRNAQTRAWEYWLNLFDANTSGSYQAEFQAPANAVLPPLLQFIPDRTVTEGQQVSFLVEASSPGGKTVHLGAAPLPTGATFTAQAADPAAPTVSSALFDWTPQSGSAGRYLIVYTASDGTLSATRSAVITVESAAPPPGPGTPSIAAPLPDAQVTRLRPELSVQTASNAQDPTTLVQFELYADQAMTKQVAATALARPADASQPTVWTLSADLNDNTRYWWRARASDGSLYSPWAHGRFFINLYNDAPDSFNLSLPVPDAQVTTLTPTLTWTNSMDRDGDAIAYSVTVYRDGALSQTVEQAAGLAPDASGSTSWTMTQPLENHATYYWRVVAQDSLGGQTPSSARSFVVNTGNSAPTTPIILSPLLGSQSTSADTRLLVQNSTDADNDLLTYVFEIDTVNTFDSGNKRSSDQVIQNLSGSTGWMPTNLVENQHYWWRAKAQDGFAESSWAVADFVQNAVNEPPPAPNLRNPGNGAWSSTRMPTLEAHPVTDPESDGVTYQFEIYRDAALTDKAAGGNTGTPQWLVPVQLADRTTYWWRARALDSGNAASAWSAAATLAVSTGPYQEPGIAVTTPATLIQPTRVAGLNGPRKQVVINWEGNDPNIEPTVALYYATSNAGFTGIPIVDGLRQAHAGSHQGSHVWDVTDLAPGAYYVYGMIYDARSLARAWAPGAVVVTPAVQSGHVSATAASALTTSEDGAKATFTVRLDSQPSAPVTVPVASSSAREGLASPASLNFTPSNWNQPQTVTMTGQNDCMRDGVRQYQALVGPVQSLDPEYMGVSATPLAVGNSDSAYGPSQPNNNMYLTLCSITLRSMRRVDARTWEYTLDGLVGNIGPALRGLTATLTSGPPDMQFIQPQFEFGALQTGEAGRSTNTVTLRSRSLRPASYFPTAAPAFRWTATLR